MLCVALVPKTLKPHIFQFYDSKDRVIYPYLKVCNEEQLKNRLFRSQQL